jgi:hypothetical protein
MIVDRAFCASASGLPIRRGKTTGDLDSSEKELDMRDGASSDRAAPITIAVRTAFAAKLDSATLEISPVAMIDQELTL